MDFLIYQPLGWLLGTIYSFVNSYGIALIVFTIIVKVILFPLSVHQQKTMAKTAKLQPKILELQKKYKNNKEKQSEELMKLYKEEKANPTAGCLPMLIQLPIIFGLYRVITKPLQYIVGLSVEQMEGIVTKLNLVDLSQVDDAQKAVSNFISIKQIDLANALSNNIGMFPEYSHLNMIDFSFMGMDLAAAPTFAFNLLILIPIIAGITAYLSSWYTMNYGPSAAMATDQTRSMNKTMIVTMPLMSIWMTFTFPAGVGIYWIMSNVMMVVQQFMLNIFFPVKKEEIKSKKQVRKEERAESRKDIFEE